MTLEAVRAEVSRLVALYLVMHPERADVPQDVLRRGAAAIVMARERAAHAVNLWERDR